MVDAGTWSKVQGNPLFPHLETDEWDRHPSAPHILRVGDRLRMYYYGQRGDERRIGFAEAPVDDPFSWTKHPGNPVLDLSGPGGLDSVWAAYPWVLPITDTLWYIYYAGFGDEWVRDDFKLNHTMVAISEDAGMTWRRSGLGSLLPAGDSGSPHEHGSGSCAVLKVGDEYWMWYTALREEAGYTKNLNIGIALATSKDGLNFIPHEAGKVIGPDPDNPIEDYVCSKPVVYFKDGKYQLWYNSAGPGYRVRYAESEDGIHFESDPRVIVETSESGWDSVMTEYVCTLEQSDRDLLFYCGNHFAGIGVAERLK